MLSPLEESLLSIMMVIIMFGMGASLTFKDFKLSMRHPRPLGLAFHRSIC